MRSVPIGLVNVLVALYRRRLMGVCNIVCYIEKCPMVFHKLYCAVNSPSTATIVKMHECMPKLSTFFACWFFLNGYCVLILVI